LITIRVKLEAKLPMAKGGAAAARPGNRPMQMPAESRQRSTARMDNTARMVWRAAASHKLDGWPAAASLKLDSAIAALTRQTNTSLAAIPG